MPGVSRSHEISVQDHRLHYLSIAARHGSMRAAADVLGIAPSSISRQIGLLERALSIDLVEKGSHKMQLTEAGRLLIDYYDRRAVEHQDLLTQLAELRHIRSRTIRLACGEGLLATPFLPVLKTLCDRFPDTNLDLKTATSEEVQRMVLNDAAQIGLLLETPADVRLKVLSMSPQPVEAILPASHPLTRWKRLTLENLANERLVMPGKTSRLYEIFNSVFAARGLALDVVLSSTSLGPILDSVQAGLGITMLPRILVADRLGSGGLVSRAIECAEFEEFGLHLVTRVGRRLTPAAQALLRGMISACRTLNALDTDGQSCPVSSPNETRGAV